MKKILALCLAVVMIIGVAAGCAATPASQPGSDAPVAAPAPANSTTVTVLFEGSTVSDDAAVIAAANERLKALGVPVILKPIWGTWGDFNDKATTALDTGSTDIDIYFTCSWTSNDYVGYARKGLWARLDDPANNLLEKYGQKMKAAVPEALWDGFVTSGTQGVGIYGVPGYKDYAQLYCWDVNNTMLGELGIKYDSIPWDKGGEVFYTPEFENALKAAKEQKGSSFFPLIFEAANLPRYILNSDADPYGNFLLEFDPKDPRKPAKPTITNLYDNPAYTKYLNKIREFYLAGYIDPIISNAQQANDAITSLKSAGNFLISVITYAYGYDVTASADRGIDNRFPPFSSAIVSTGSVQGAGYGVSVYSKNKEASVQFLDAWYTDAELATILAYGLEGTHYTKNSDGTIKFDVDARKSYSPWRNGMGNIFVGLPPEEGSSLKYWDEFKAYNEAGVPVALLGWAFDTDPVKNQIGALANVRDEFMYALNTGSVDPSVELPKFQEKLKANGMDEVLAEANKQVTAYLAK